MLFYAMQLDRSIDMRGVIVICLSHYTGGLGAFGPLYLLDRPTTAEFLRSQSCPNKSPLHFSSEFLAGQLLFGHFYWSDEHSASLLEVHCYQRNIFVFLQHTVAYWV